MVAGMGGVARRAFQRGSCPAPDRRTPRGIYAARRRAGDLRARRLANSPIPASSVAAFAGLRRTGCIFSFRFSPSGELLTRINERIGTSL
jgi:hypothetical protein